jgi:DNA-binding response OmpR family regulator
MALSESAASPPDAAAPARLLIVDDDFMLRSMTAATLRHAGFAVSECASGEDALAQFEALAPALVLLDVMMPGLDGYEVCRRLRALPAGARVPVWMLTGMDDAESRAQAQRSGATDFISKPINWAVLVQRVRAALRAGGAP